MSAQIVILSGPDRGRSFPLPAGAALQVGRSQTTPTQLTDPTVSRVHCHIEFDGNRAVLENISANGTHVNGKAVSRHELRHGDVVRIGGTEFRYQIDAVGEAETVYQPAPAPGDATLPGTS